MAGAPDRPRRVALVIRRIAGRIGGAERVACTTASLLAGDGVDVTVLHWDRTPGPPAYDVDPRVRWRNLWAPLASRGVAHRVLHAVAGPGVARAPAAWLARNLHFTARLVDALRADRPDAVIAFLPPANTPSLIAGRLTGTPVIPTNHSVPAQDYERADRWDPSPIDRRLRRRALTWAARIHVLAPAYAAWFPPALRDRVVAIPNPVAPAFRAPPPGAARRPIVLSVGRLVDSKRHHLLVEAWTRVAPRHAAWRLVIVGDGPNRDALAGQIAAAGLADRIELLGERRDLAPLYQEATLLCHPSAFEGFGLAVAEALACGLPVVAFAECAGVRDLVHDGVSGVLVAEAGGAAGLADALDALIADAPRRAALGARAPAAVAALTPEAYLARWRRVLDEVIG